MSNKRNNNKVEYLRNYDEIVKLSSQGLDISAIYNKLVEEGKIAMNFQSFGYYYKGYYAYTDSRSKKKRGSKTTDEVLKHKDEILSLINQGYPISYVYKTLKKSGKYSYGRVSFYLVLKRLGIKRVEVPNID